MISNKLRNQIVFNFCENNEWLIANELDDVVSYDFLDDSPKEWNSKEELLEALNNTVLEWQAIEPLEEVKELNEALQTETVRQQVLETLEEVEDTQVQTLNNLYNISPSVEEEQEYPYPFWINNQEMINWTKEIDAINSIEFPNIQEESYTEVEEIEEESAPLSFISIISVVFLILLVVLGVTIKLLAVSFKALNWGLNNWLTLENENIPLILLEEK